MSWYHWGIPCVFGVSLQGVSRCPCHSQQNSLGVCDILVPESPLLKWTVSLKTVQLSSTTAELCSSASRWLQISLTNICLLLSYFSLKTPNLFGTFLPCGCRTGWMRRLSADNKPVICPTICTTHPVCPSFALWQSQWDASIWSRGASMIFYHELVYGILCWWSVVHALHTSLKGGGHCRCTSLLLQFQSLLPRFGCLCLFRHRCPPRGWVCLSRMLQKSQNPDHHRTCL